MYSKMKKANWIYHILQRNCPQEDIIGGKILVEVRIEGTAK